MSDIQSIKKRAISIKNIGKITKSLETVSALQLKNAEKVISNTKQYMQSLEKLTRKLATHPLADSHELTNQPKNSQKILVVLVTSDRGLVGGQNLLLMNTVSAFLDEKEAKDCDFVVLGNKGVSFAKQNGLILSEWLLTDRGRVGTEVTQDLVSFFGKGQYKQIVLAYNEFVSVTDITPTIEQFLPLYIPMTQGLTKEIFEPNFSEVFTQVIHLYLNQMVRHAISEAEASEHASRTLAMKSASENAQELSIELTQKYNTARQESVTEEILEGAFHHG